MTPTAIIVVHIPGPRMVMMIPKKKNIRIPVATTFSLKICRKPGNFKFSMDFFRSPILPAILEVIQIPNIC